MKSTDRIQFQTSAQLIAAIEKIAGGIIRLDEMYVMTEDGADLGEIALQRETLSDGFVAYNLIIQEAAE